MPRDLPGIGQRVDAPARIDDRARLGGSQNSVDEAQELVLDHPVAHRIFLAADRMLDEYARPFAIGLQDGDARLVLGELWINSNRNPPAQTDHRRGQHNFIAELPFAGETFNKRNGARNPNAPPPAVPRPRATASIDHVCYTIADFEREK
jgi:hypothetical protein